MGEFKHLFGQRSPAPAAVDIGALDKEAPVAPAQQAFNKVTALDRGGESSSGVASSAPSAPKGSGGGSSGSPGVSKEISGAAGAGLPTSQPSQAGVDAITKQILDFVNAAATQDTLTPSGANAPEQFFERSDQPGAASLADVFSIIGPQQFKNMFFPNNSFAIPSDLAPLNEAFARGIGQIGAGDPRDFEANSVLSKFQSPFQRSQIGNLTQQAIAKLRESGLRGEDVATGDIQALAEKNFKSPTALQDILNMIAGARGGGGGG